MMSKILSKVFDLLCMVSIITLIIWIITFIELFSGYFLSKIVPFSLFQATLLSTISTLLFIFASAFFVLYVAREQDEDELRQIEQYYKSRKRILKR